MPKLGWIYAISGTTFMTAVYMVVQAVMTKNSEALWAALGMFVACFLPSVASLIQVILPWFEPPESIGPKTQQAIRTLVGRQDGVAPHGVADALVQLADVTGDPDVQIAANRAELAASRSSAQQCLAHPGV